MNTRVVPVDERVLLWLLGECAHPETGRWFEPPGNKPFWWRTFLRKAMLTAPPPPKPTVIGIKILWAKYKTGNDANARMDKENFRAAVLEANTNAATPQPELDHLAAPDSREREIIAAATALIPFLVEGWDEDDGPEHYEASNAACDRLIAAVKGPTNVAPEQGGQESRSSHSNECPADGPAPVAAPDNSVCSGCGTPGMKLGDGHECTVYGTVEQPERRVEEK